MTYDPAWRVRWKGRYRFTSPPPDPPGAADADTIFVGWRVWVVNDDPPRPAPHRVHGRRGLDAG